MKPARNLCLAVAAAAFSQSPAETQPLTTPPPKTFHAAPGTNTLAAAREAMLAWRAAGHSNNAATIRLSPGDYWLQETLVLGPVDGNVTWEAEDPQHTTISSGRRITNLEADAAGAWRAKAGAQFGQLYVNGSRATRARAPAEGFFQVGGVKQDELPAGRARLTIKAPEPATACLPPDPAELHNVQLLVFHKWDTSRYVISSFDTEARTITVEGERMTTWNPWNEQSRFILENSPLMPIPPGGWLLDAEGTLRYHPRPGESLEATECIAPVLERLVQIRGATNLHFRGLCFQHAAYNLPKLGCPPVQAAVSIEAAIQIDGSRNVTFEKCQIEHTGNYGIWFRQGCSNCRLEHCLLEDLGAGGVRIGETEIRDHPSEQTGGIVVDSNIIRGCGRVHPSAVPIWVGQSANNRITHNDLSDTFYTAISVGWTWGYGRSLAASNVIAFNRIHRIGQGVLSDLGAIYTLGVAPGSLCFNNVIFDVRAHDYGGWGIYPDEGSTGWRIESNLVWNCTCVNPPSGGAFHQHYGASNYLGNNIFALSSGPPIQATRPESHLSFVLEHNLIVSSNAPFFTGPWDKLQYESRSNCFVSYGPSSPLFPKGDLSSCQAAGHEAGSILTNLEFQGQWPDITLPSRSPAFDVGFRPFDPKQAGVYGDGAWKRRAHSQ
ncbi:conserved exported hypothetical protein [Verrucomicrobia bacterium]|nr:conserved exported hypothetical protein [Verrucomicrobiota bacterium]